MLDIYKASAGSGKTFALTLAYFRIIFKAPLEYKHILAVTFTNKATEEMKSRIINELHRLAEGEKSDYGEILKQELQFTDEQLKNKAILLRNLLLHDYGRLSVTTIDRFFQRILKSFTRELGIFPGYNIELDSDFVLLKAVDHLMQQLNNYPELQNLVQELMNQKVEVGESWNVKNQIVELGKELFKENYMLMDQRDLQKFEDKELLKNYRDSLAVLIKEFEQHLNTIASEAVQLIKDAGLELSDFKSGSRGCAAWFYKLLAGEYAAPSPTTRKGVNGVEEWRTQKSPRKSEIEAVAEKLITYLNTALIYYDSKYKYYLSAELIIKNLYQLGTLRDIYKEIRDYCNEKDLLLLSDTTTILNQLIANNDATFLYEKYGNTYKHLMIDEFQDTSGMQWNNFRPLIVNSLSEGAKAMIVGDVKQSIYRWRNGEWGLLAHGVEKEFQQLGVNQMVLKDNWRSAREVVEFNNDFFEKAADFMARLFLSEVGAEDKRGGQILEAYQALRQNPKKQKKGYVEIKFGPNDKAENANISILHEVVTILEDLIERGGKVSDAVILVRDGKEGAMVADYLMEYNKSATDPIQFISNDSLFINSSPYIQFIVAILRYLVEPYDLVNKATVVYLYHTFVRKGESKELDELFRQIQGEEPVAFADTSFNCTESLSVSYSIYEIVETIIDRLKLKEETQEVPYMIAFQDMIHEYEANNSNSITLFMEWWEKEGKKRVLTTSEEVDAVRILTIHKSKGLEFETVILPFCSWDLDSIKPVRWLWCTNQVEGFDTLHHVPLPYSGKLKETIYREDYLNEHLKAFIDNLNLLYVAMTRAKTELYLRPYTPYRRKDGDMSLSTIGAIVWQVLKDLNMEWNEGDIFILGEKQELGDKNKMPNDTLSLETYPVWSPESRIQVKYRFEEYVDSEGSDKSAISEGKLLHEIFRSIQTTEEVDQAVQEVYLNGMISRDEKAGIVAKVKDYLRNSEAARWFSPECKVINEKDILLPSGQKVRPDRVVILPDKTVQVVDYKFGQRMENKYLKQVAFYCNTLKKMGYTRVEGFVWYVKLGKIVSV